MTIEPNIVSAIDEVRRAVAEARRRGETVGFVPTMGALHEGHAALIRRARADHAFVVVSIFVNPTQFGPNEDLSRYPRTFAEDLALCGREGAALVYSPANDAMYPEPYRTWVTVDELGNELCGASRPGHFRGVTTVVIKLFNIVLADAAYFGQKDAQQAAIIRQMARDLDCPTRVVVCPTVREADGLALSSRNRYLTPVQRSNATVLHRALSEVLAIVEGGETSATALEELMARRVAETPGARLDYAKIVDAVLLQRVETIKGDALAAVAVFFGTTRLIDNQPLPAPSRGIE